MRERPDALFVAATPFSPPGASNWCIWRRAHAVPATYVAREFADVGGLMSYGASLTDTWRQVGVYAGRILKGAKPADLPVVQPTKFELVINLRQPERSGSPCRRRCSPAPTR